MTEHQTLPPPYSASTEPDAASKRTTQRWYRRTWVVASTTCLVGIGIGASAGATDVKASPEYQQVAHQRDQMRSALSATKDDLSTAQSDANDLNDEISTLNDQMADLEGDIPKREAAVKKAETAVQKREKSVAARERSVRKRESAVGLVERTIAANTVSDGIYEVGVDIKAGTYKTRGGSSTCYWATRNSADGDITNNSLTAGPSVVTVQEGEFVEFTCGGAEWVLQR